METLLHYLKRGYRQNMASVHIIALTLVITLVGSIGVFANYGHVDLGKYLITTIIGIALMFITIRLDSNWLSRWPLIIYLGTILLQLVTRLFGFTMQGRYYLGICGITISPVLEVALFVIAFSGFLEKYRGKGTPAVLKLIGFALVSLLLVYEMRGDGLMIPLFICYTILIAFAISKTHFGDGMETQRLSQVVSIAVLIVLLTLYGMSMQYKLEKLNLFLSGGQTDPQGAGYMQVMTNYWLASSHWFGKTEATFQGYLPEVLLPIERTDYPLVNMIVLHGWLFGIILVLLIAAFIVKLFMMIKKTQSGRGFYLVFAFGLMLASQFLLSVLMNFNLLPAAGIRLPLAGESGTGYLIHMAMLGLILSVVRGNSLSENGG